MSRVITFSRTFPAYHPRRGAPTGFVEKVLNQLGIGKCDAYSRTLKDLNHRLSGQLIDAFMYSINEGAHKCMTKSHTIRSGNRWKVGDKFSPRVWSGKPYCSPQITIAPDIEIVKTWDFEYFEVNGLLGMKLDGEPFYNLDVAVNDGLGPTDFINWFGLSPSFKNERLFNGQIICWNKNINY